MSDNELMTTKTNLPAVLSFESDTALDDTRFDQDDLKLPFLYIIQSSSPQLKDTDPKYIPDAKQGEILNTVTNTRYSRKDGVTVIPVKYERLFVEWRDKIPVATYSDSVYHDTIRTVRSADAQGRLHNIITEDSQQGTPGNEIVETRQFICLVVDKATGDTTPAVLPMSSTQIKYAKIWTTRLSALRETFPSGVRKQPAIFQTVWRLTTVSEQNEKGTWFSWNINYEGPIWSALTPEVQGIVYPEAVRLCESLKGTKVNTTETTDDMPF